MQDFREQIGASTLTGEHDEHTKVMMEQHQATIWTALPAIVKSFDAGAVTITAQPTIQGLLRDRITGNQTPVTMPLLVDVPVCFPRGGGYTMSFPITAGDECLVVFASRCIDGWWQSGQVSPPTEHRLHDLSDGFAIVGPFSQKTKIGNISGSTVQLRSDDGLVYVEVDQGGGAVNVIAPTQVHATAPTVLIDGNLKVNGTITATGDITAGTISLQKHRTSGVLGGTGTSGIPVV